MKTHTRVFLGAEQALKPLKADQVRCPLCRKGIKINKLTKKYSTHRHNGYSCPVNNFPVAEVDKPLAVA